MGDGERKKDGGEIWVAEINGVVLVWRDGCGMICTIVDSSIEDSVCKCR